MSLNIEGIDVSAYQNSSLNSYINAGAKWALVKISEGTNYKNPNGASQIASAKAAGISVGGYFYAIFSNNQALAQYNAQYAVATAQQMGLRSGSILAVDWEVGDGNEVDGDIQANTQAILIAMSIIEHAGYKPMLYTGAYVLTHNIDYNSILRVYPSSLWVASYINDSGVATNEPDFGYFPNVDGIAIWQYTDNWHGLSVDGNTMVIDVFSGSNESEIDEEMVWHPEVKYNELGRFKVNRAGGADLYDSETLNNVVATGKDNTYKIFRANNGAVEAGTNQWFSQADGITKINPLATNPSAHAICKITTNDAWTQNEAKAGQAGIKKLAQGSTWKVYGRSGQYLVIGGGADGKYIDGNKTNIVL